MTMPPAGPQPGYQGPQGPQSSQPPQGYGDPTIAISRPLQEQMQRQPQPPNPGQQPQQPQPPKPPRPKGSNAVLLLGLIAIAGVVLGLSITENGGNAWDSVNAWGGVAVAGAVAVLAPALGRSFGLGTQRAWQVAVCGAGALVLFWVLFTLPSVGSNTSLLVTIGVAAGVIAAWIAPRDDAEAESGPARQQQHW
ncbi:MAG TPA: hypothetical protein VGH43_19490 [Jatrophihabitans sp.]|jgi:hypothetical protein